LTDVSSPELTVTNLENGMVKLNLNETSTSRVDVEVISLTGQTVLKTYAQPYVSEITLNLSNKNMGLHIVRVSYDNLIKTKKFIVK
jgi:hypothetical protein